MKIGKVQITLLPTSAEAKKSFAPKYAPYLVRATQYLANVGSLPKGPILVVLGSDVDIKRLKKTFFSPESSFDPLTLPSPSQPKADLPLAERGEGLGEGEQNNSDVVSFAYPENTDPRMEIIINVEQARRQKPPSWPLTKEILFLYIHGILHCMGWDDKTANQRKKMLGLGQRILNKIWANPS